MMCKEQWGYRRLRRELRWAEVAPYFRGPSMAALRILAVLYDQILGWEWRLAVFRVLWAATRICRALWIHPPRGLASQVPDAASEFPGRFQPHPPKSRRRGRPRSLREENSARK